MSKAEDKARMFVALHHLGITMEHAVVLRRLEMTLHRWAERECGDEYGRAIERDDETGLPYETYDLGQNGKRGRRRIADKERGALKRLAAIMEFYPELVAYHQGDPRGCALYIVRKSDVPEGEHIESYYTRGVAVCS